MSQEADFFNTPIQPPIQQESYDILRQGHSVAPSAIEDLLLPAPIVIAGRAGPATPETEQDAEDDYNARLARLQEDDTTTSSYTATPPPPSIETSQGSSSRLAIVIEDSPTPPLRPLASPQARLEASESGRCGVFHEPSPEKEENKVILGELVCPICLGPPAPFVVTECGHAFCGPCLHSALIAQPITQQLMRDLPNVAGNTLEGTCPVCRRPLEGGWGRALRGAVLRMGTAEIPV